jgi:hypothetical protein
MLIEHGPSHLN